MFSSAAGTSPFRFSIAKSINSKLQQQDHPHSSNTSASTSHGKKRARVHFEDEDNGVEDSGLAAAREGFIQEPSVFFDDKTIIADLQQHQQSSTIAFSSLKHDSNVSNVSSPVLIGNRPVLLDKPSSVFHSPALIRTLTNQDQLLPNLPTTANLLLSSPVKKELDQARLQMIKLETLLKQAEAEKQRLQIEGEQRNRKQETRLEEMAQKLQEMEVDLKQMFRDEQQAKQDLEVLKQESSKERHNMSQRIKEASTSLQEEREKAIDQGQLIYELQRQLRELKGQKEMDELNLGAELDSLKAENARLQAKIQIQKEESTITKEPEFDVQIDAKQQEEEKKDEHDVHHQPESSFTKQLLSMANRVPALEDEIRLLKAERDSFKQAGIENNTLREQVSSLEARIHFLLQEREAKTITASLNNTTASPAHSGPIMEEAHSLLMIASLKDQLGEMQAQLASSQASEQASKTKMDRLQAELQERKTMVQTLEQTLISMQRQLEIIQEECRLLRGNDGGDVKKDEDEDEDE